MEEQKMRHGWFVIPGVQTGDRTLEDQTVALKHLWAECANKSVLDLGCAEGLISLECAKHGAARVIGLEMLSAHLDVANAHCAHPVITYLQQNLNDPPYNLLDTHGSFDIVLALGIAHKLRDPAILIRFASAATKAGGLLLMRSGKKQQGGLIFSKHYPDVFVDAHAYVQEHGFTLERTAHGTAKFGERTEYWRLAQGWRGS